MSVRVIWDEKPGILVPTTAVSTLGGQNFVYVASEQQPDEVNNQDHNSNSQSEGTSSSLIAEQRPVKLGNIQDQSYQVISGLKEGDEIAVSNILSLRDGTQIKRAEEAANNTETEANQASEL